MRSALGEQARGEDGVKGRRFHRKQLFTGVNVGRRGEWWVHGRGVLKRRSRVLETAGLFEQRHVQRVTRVTWPILRNKKTCQS